MRGQATEVRHVADAAETAVTARRTAGGALLVTGILVLAFNLRAMITGLPPVFPELQSVLHVSASTLAVLASVPQRLVVLRDAASGWMDLGNPKRVFEALTLSRIQPSWVNIQPKRRLPNVFDVPGLN